MGKRKEKEGNSSFRMVMNHEHRVISEDLSAQFISGRSYFDQCVYSVASRNTSMIENSFKPVVLLGKKNC